MTRQIIGRVYEQSKLEFALGSKEAEFIAVYGRRRVGKTYLIRNFFHENKDCIFLNISGILNASLAVQLGEFHEEIHQTFGIYLGGVRLEKPKNWMDAFKNLTFALSLASNFLNSDEKKAEKKIVLFFDEFPWMATKKSKLLQALDYYWNKSWVDMPQVILIICGSAASWIIKNILNNKRGLHNRITMRLPIKPFNLKETQDFLKSRGVNYDPMQILQLYMAIGGIPYYLKSVEKGLSAIQNIDQLCFKKEGTLLDEFKNLFSSLFNQSDMHEALVKLIGSKREGVNREELEKTLNYVGGSLTNKLKELEEAGFIAKCAMQGRTYGQYYKLVDEYSLFYLTWIAPGRLNSFEDMAGAAEFNTWAGYAFEAVCFKHLSNIRRALHIKESTAASSWRYIPKKKENCNGAQIDLLFDRADGVINLCEIKYSTSPYLIDKSYAANLKNKIEAYQKITKTTKQIFISMISTLGLKESMYSEELVSSEVKLEDLFKDISE